MSPRTTVAPSSTIAWAVAAPRPRAAPLIRQTLSSSRPMFAPLTDHLFEPGVLQDLLVLVVQWLHERRQLEHLLDRAVDLDVALGDGQGHVELPEPGPVGGVGRHVEVDLDLHGDVGAELGEALAEVDGDDRVGVGEVELQCHAGGVELLLQAVGLEGQGEDLAHVLVEVLGALVGTHSRHTPCLGPGVNRIGTFTTPCTCPLDHSTSAPSASSKSGMRRNSSSSSTCISSRAMWEPRQRWMWVPKVRWRLGLRSGTIAAALGNSRSSRLAAPRRTSIWSPSFIWTPQTSTSRVARRAGCTGAQSRRNSSTADGMSVGSAARRFRSSGSVASWQSIEPMAFCD